MTTSVIILAQGSQRRLSDLKIPKQLLTLEHDGKAIPIIVRTIRQLARMGIAHRDITVICAGELASYLGNPEVMSVGVRIITLAEPGNSSLKGISRCLWLESDALCPNFHVRPDRVVVLFGDVVYSHHTLKWLVDPRKWLGVNDPANARFVVSDDLSQSEGEVWGVRWEVKDSTVMRDALRNALMKHPPFSEYQPGQMRQWMFQAQQITPYVERSWGVLSIVRSEDYTMDVDTPKDIPLLKAISAQVWQDDLEADFQW